MKKKRIITDVEDRIKWPLDFKVEYAKEKIREWHDYYDGNVHVTFSGGKDSTVLLHMAREIYPDIKAVYVNTGLEFPEINAFIRKQKNITHLKPRKHFRAVIKDLGYPVVSKQTSEYVEQVRNNLDKICSQVVRLRLVGLTAKGKYLQRFMIPAKWQFLIDAPFKISARCCKYMKKYPFWDFERKTKSMPIIGMMATDSAIRKSTYVFSGCNAFNAERPRSAPMSVWTRDDVWDYIKYNDIPYSEIYDMGYKNTGCMFCMFGIHLDHKNMGGRNRFDLMRDTHPKLYHYCMDKLGVGRVLDYIFGGD